MVAEEDKECERRDKGESEGLIEVEERGIGEGNVTPKLSLLHSL